MRLSYLLLVAGAVALSPARALAQVEGLHVAGLDMSPRRCDIIVRGLAESRDVEPTALRDLRYLYLCADSAIRIADALRLARNQSDSAVLAALSSSARYAPSEPVLEALMIVAADREAAVPARIFAFQALVSITPPGRYVPYDVLAGVGAEAVHPSLGVRMPFRCRPEIYETTSHRPPVLRSLEDPARRRTVRDLARRIFEDPGEEPSVRFAASCLFY